jgi:hypothetical protein
MATSKVYRPSVDYTLATEVTVQTSPVNEKTAFIPAMQIVTPTGGVGAATATVTSVASTATSTSIIAANTSRQGLSISNTDANILYLLLGGGTASATNFTVAIGGATATAIGYYEVPYGFTGAITGIWAVDGTGAALVTEYT